MGVLEGVEQVKAFGGALGQIRLEQGKIIAAQRLASCMADSAAGPALPPYRRHTESS